ncbi:MAG: BatD family protein [Halioglobus sp.]
MTFSGKAARLLMLLACLFTAGQLQAAVEASVDRNRVELGDSLRLTISTEDDDAELSDIPLQALQGDFDILTRSTNSQTRFVNGRRSHSKQLIIEIAPRRAGDLRIPALRVGNYQTAPIAITVSAASDSAIAAQALAFEAEVDRDTVYVQGQVLLTLRILQGVNLEDRSVSELTLEDAFVKPLEQRSFQRTIDGQRWLVHELRYAIFPEQSGTLRIPAQTFTGREIAGRRSFFDLDRGRRLQRSTEPLEITVLPRPATYPDDTWLPARQLSVVEEWSTPPENLRSGESATRTVRIRGEGLQGAQLPPVLFTPVAGLKFYPDQPEISDSEEDGGLVGMRRDSTAIVPTRAGRVTLPELRIPWWDTETRQTRYAVLPARELNILPGDTGNQVAAPTDPVVIDASRAPAPAASGAERFHWKLIAIVSSLGWLATLAYLLFMRRRPARNRPDGAAGKPSAHVALQEVLDACANGDAARARRALLTWGQEFSQRPTLSSLQALASVIGDPALEKELRALDTHLYGNRATPWQGGALAACLQQLAKNATAGAQAAPAALDLYPRAG